MLPTLDLLVLLAVLQLGDEAYGVSVAEAVTDARGADVSMASVYVALERLEERGLVRSTLGEPTPERGGRAKRYFTVTPAGLRAVDATRAVLTRMWAAVPAFKGDAR
ncbi:MAG: PadR family transcriptional regulator [Vicinamibacterales bacterium]